MQRQERTERPSILGFRRYEVLQRLKADEVLCQIPVIMISALSESDAAVRCIEMGAKDYLPKPFNPTLLKTRIGAKRAPKFNSA